MVAGKTLEGNLQIWFDKIAPIKVEAKSTVHGFILTLLTVAAVVVTLEVIPVARRTIPGHIVRWCLGKPGATQGVNDAADKILSSGWEKDLTNMADALMIEFTPIATNLPEAFMGGRSIPAEKLPTQYRQLGGIYSRLNVVPELVLRQGQLGDPDQIVIDWAHMRHAIMIYAVPPHDSPTGFYVRKVGNRIFVVADKS